MAKVDVNTASREELLAVGGLRPETVEEILKLRRKEKITRAEMLEQVPGIGPATLEQLKKALDFGDQGQGNGDGRGQERERRGGERAEAATAEASRGAARTGSEAAEAASRGLRVVQQAAGAVVEIERALAQRSAEGTAELGRALIEVMNEQTRHNLETFSALTQAVDWDQVTAAVRWDRVLQLQGEYLRASLERAAQLTQRYLELGQAVLAATAETARDQAKRAA